MNGEQLKLLFQLLITYGTLILLGIAYLITYFIGSQQMPKVRDKVLNRLKPALKGKVTKFKIIEHSIDSIELKCEPKKPGIKAFSIFIMLRNRTWFHNVLFSKLLHDSDSLIFAAKFGTKDTTLPPDHELYIVPYRNKYIIRKRFEEFVKIDDIQTKSEYFNNNYMIKSTNLAKTRGLLNDKKFQEMMRTLEPYLTYIFVNPPETSKDPHIQVEFTFVDDEKIMKQLVDLFFYIVEYYTALRGYKVIKKKNKKN